MGALRVRAHAKINLFLSVGAQDGTGYHQLTSVMQSISLADELTISPFGSLEIECDRADLRGPDNLVLRAASQLQQHVGTNDGAYFRLEKRIPVAAGLGGGSADAAAALTGLNRLWGLGLTDSELREIGREVGADVPFCLTGGTAVATGIGERITALAPVDFGPFVIAKPPGGLLARDVYDEFDRLGGAPEVSVEPLLDAVRRADREAIIAQLANQLDPAATRLAPDIEKVRALAVSAGAIAVLVSGSGPALLVIPPEPTRAAVRRITEALAGSAEAFVVRSHSRGVEMVAVEQDVNGEGA